MSEPVAPAPVPARDRTSTAAFVVGLIAAITGVVYFVSIPCALVGLALGTVAIRRPSAVRRLALGGIVLSAIGLFVGLGLVAYLLVEDDTKATTIDGIQSDTGDDQHPPQRDLQPDVTCGAEVDELRASGDVRNHTAEVVTYKVITAWERNGHVIAQHEATVDDVAPGGTAPWQSIVPIDEDETGPTTCRVIRINRLTDD